MSNDLRDELLRKVLEMADCNESIASHPSDEELAMLAARQVDDSAREALLCHLAECDECRETVAALLKLDETVDPAIDGRRATSAWWQRTPVWVAAVAATVLVAAAVLLWRPSSATESLAYQQARQHLEAGDFAGVRRIVAEAEQRGQLSNRLRNLDAQAMLQIAHEVALAGAGRLSDFGYDIGGVVARGGSVASSEDRKAAAARLAETDADNRECMLNRGYLLLLEGRYSEAADVFRARTHEAANDSLAWLGAGLAAFLQDDFSSAEAAFRLAATLTPQDATAAVNLAMTLEEQDKMVEAQAVWKEVLQVPSLSETERKKIELHMMQQQLVP